MSDEPNAAAVDAAHEAIMSIMTDWLDETIDEKALARAAVGAVMAWRPIETAPYETAVKIKVGNMTFHAMLVPDASENEDGSCDQWCAVIEGEHPPCWSGGACWWSNENEDRSMQPEAWMPILFDWDKQ